MNSVNFHNYINSVQATFKSRSLQKHITIGNIATLSRSNISVKPIFKSSRSNIVLRKQLIEFQKRITIDVRSNSPTLNNHIHRMNACFEPRSLQQHNPIAHTSTLQRVKIIIKPTLISQFSRTGGRKRVVDFQKRETINVRRASRLLNQHIKSMQTCFQVGKVEQNRSIA